MTIKVSTDELLRLTVEDIGDEILFEIVDEENETDEHLAHLRKLYQQRAEKDQSRPMNADELRARLGRLPAGNPCPTARSRSSSTSSSDEEKDKEGSWREEMEAYHDLVADGGRPSHPVTLGRDVIDNPEKYGQYKDILWFWHFKGGFYCEFRYQLIYWRRFRDYQDQKRKYYIPRNRWQEYVKCIQESQQNLGCTWNLRVLEDRHQQNRLEDWNEFRAFYYRKLKIYQKQVEPAEREALLYQKKYEDAQARLTDVITDPKVIYSRLTEINASEKEVAEAKSKLSLAEIQWKAAKRNKSKKRTVLLKMARQELRSARNNLQQISGTEEMRRLRDGHELHLAHKVMLVAEGGQRAAKLELKRWELFLKWIDDQYPNIAAECELTPRRSAGVESCTGKAPTADLWTKQAAFVQDLPSLMTEQPLVEKPAPPRRSQRLQQVRERLVGVTEPNILRGVDCARVSKKYATKRSW